MVVGVGKAVEEAPHLSGAPAGPVGGDDLFTPIAGQFHRPVRRLGVTLLKRTSRSVQLTPAGETLLHEGRTALAAMARAARSAQRAGEPEPRLVVAMKPIGDGGLLPDLLTTYRAQHTDVHVDVHLCEAGEQAALLRDGRADVAFMHSPQQDFAGLDTVDLLVEHQVLVLPRHHHLAGRDHLSMTDLSTETMPLWPGTPPPTQPPHRSATPVNSPSSSPGTTSSRCYPNPSAPTCPATWCAYRSPTPPPPP